MSGLCRLLATFILWMAAWAASAHEGSTSYLAIDARGGTPHLAGRFDVALIDLAWTLPLDVDSDGALSWNEILARQGAISRVIGEGLSLTRGGKPCALSIGEPWLADRLGLPYLSVDIAAACESTGSMAITSSLLFEQDATHRVLVSVKTPTAAHAATLAPISRAWNEPAVASAWRTALSFAWQGIWHVWIGYDHLTLPAAPVAAGRRPPRRVRSRPRPRDRARSRANRHGIHGRALDHARTGRDGARAAARKADRSGDRDLARRCRC